MMAAVVLAVGVAGCSGRGASPPTTRDSSTGTVASTTTTISSPTTATTARPVVAWSQETEAAVERLEGALDGNRLGAAPLSSDSAVLEEISALAEQAGVVLRGVPPPFGDVPEVENLRDATDRVHSDFELAAACAIGAGVERRSCGAELPEVVRQAEAGWREALNRLRELPPTALPTTTTVEPFSAEKVQKWQEFRRGPLLELRRAVDQAVNVGITSSLAIVDRGRLFGVSEATAVASQTMDEMGIPRDPRVTEGRLLIETEVLAAMSLLAAQCEDGSCVGRLRDFFDAVARWQQAYDEVAE